jgi:hypothetical protein
MPVEAKSLDNHILNDRLSAALAFAAEAIRMAPDTPCIAFLLHKRHGLVEWVTALRTEEVSWMPVRATRDDSFSLDGRLAGLAAWAEKLVEVEMAVEAER